MSKELNLKLIKNDKKYNLFLATKYSLYYMDFTDENEESCVIAVDNDGDFLSKGIVAYNALSEMIDEITIGNKDLAIRYISENCNNEIERRKKQFCYFAN